MKKQALTAAATVALLIQWAWNRQDSSMDGRRSCIRINIIVKLKMAYDTHTHIQKRALSLLMLAILLFSV